jgi:hypothetical protein
MAKPQVSKIVGGSTYGPWKQSLGVENQPLPYNTEKILDGLAQNVAEAYSRPDVMNGFHTDFTETTLKTGGSRVVPIKGGRLVYPEQLYNPNANQYMYSPENTGSDRLQPTQEWAQQPHEIMNASFDGTVLLYGGSNEDKKKKDEIEKYLPNEYIEKAIEPYVSIYGENKKKSYDRVITEVKSMLSSIMIMSQKAYEELGAIADEKTQKAVTKDVNL